MASKRELQALIVLAGKIDPSLQKALNDANKKTKALSGTTKLFGKVASKSFGYMKTGVAVGAAAMGAAMTAVAVKGIMLASDLEEVQNVVDVTFGDGAGQINVWSKTALKSFGLSELAAKQYSGTLGAMLKSSGISNKHLIAMSTNLTGLAGDFASFYNLPHDESFEKIRAGISGETEPLKAIGINMSVANMEAYALAQGITTAYEKMSEADKTILRYNYLLNASKDAQNDFSRTSDGFANQLRLLQTNFSQLAAKIMNSTLPAFSKLFVQGNELMQNFADDPEKLQQLQDKVAGVVDKVVTVIPTAIRYAKDFGSALVGVYDGAVRAYEFIKSNWPTIKPLIYGIVGAMVAWKAITIGMAIHTQVMNAIKLGTIGATLAQKMLTVAKLKDAAATIYLQSLYAKDAIVKGASIAATWAMTAATSAWTVATTIATAVGGAFAAVIAFITSPIGLVIIAVAALAAGIYFLIKYWDNVTDAMARAWEWFQNLISGIPDLALVLAGPIAPLLLLIKHFDKVKDIASGAFDAVKKFFGFGSGEKDDPSGMTSLPKFARGGFANSPSIFGEAGPEAAIPLKRTPRSLGLLNKTAEVLGVGGGGNSGTGGPTFIFSPNYGNGGPSMGRMKQDFEDFKAMCEEWWEAKRRESFG